MPTPPHTHTHARARTHAHARYQRGWSKPSDDGLGFQELGITEKDPYVTPSAEALGWYFYKTAIPARFLNKCGLWLALFL